MSTDTVKHILCPKCNRWHWDDKPCNPAWLVWCPDDGDDVDDACKVHEVAAEYAAERWAEENDHHADYRLLSGHEAVVHVVPANKPDQKPQRFRITGETVPEYHSRELEPGEKEPTP